MAKFFVVTVAVFGAWGMINLFLPGLPLPWALCLLGGFAWLALSVK